MVELYEKTERILGSRATYCSHAIKLTFLFTGMELWSQLQQSGARVDSLRHIALLLLLQQ